MKPRFLIVLLVLTALVTGVVNSPAQDGSVRVLFHTGQVTVRGKGVKIGQQLSRNDVVAIGSNATLQLSVNGKVLKYSKPLNLRISDAIRQAGSGENTAVSTTVRTLAAASGAGSGGRASQAGATRIAGNRSEATSRGRAALDQARQLANDELSRRLGIQNALFKAEDAIREMYGEDDMVALEPRACGVTIGPIRFRWLRSPTARGYVVTVRDHIGDKVYETTTADTSVVWDAPALIPGVLYSWRLSDQGNPLHDVRAGFWQLDAATDAVVKSGVSAIRTELGTDNPALPLVLGGFLADNACYGEATRYFLEGAEGTPERYRDFVDRAYDVYEFDMGLSAHEMSLIERVP